MQFVYRLAPPGVASLLVLSVAGCGELAIPTAPGSPAVSSAAGSLSSSPGMDDRLTDPVVAARASSVPICHLTSEEMIITQDGEALGLTGHVIFVAPSAEAAHCRHGDHTPRPEKVRGDVCQRRIDRPTPNVQCAGVEQIIRPQWASGS